MTYKLIILNNETVLMQNLLVDFLMGYNFSLIIQQLTLSKELPTDGGPDLFQIGERALSCEPLIV